MRRSGAELEESILCCRLRMTLLAFQTMPTDFKKWLCLTNIVLLLAGCDSREDRINAAEAKERAAELLDDKGEYVQAVNLCREALTELTKLLGSDHPKTIHCRYNLSGFLQGAGTQVAGIIDSSAWRRRRRESLRTTPTGFCFARCQ